MSDKSVVKQQSQQLQPTQPTEAEAPPSPPPEQEQSHTQPTKTSPPLPPPPQTEQEQSWIDILSQMPLFGKVALGIGGGIAALALATYAAFVRESGPVEGSARYTAWKETIDKAQDVDEIQEDAALVEELKSARRPDVGLVSKVRSQIKRRLKSRPPPTARNFLIVVKMVDSKRNAYVTNAQGALQRAWKTITDIIGTDTSAVSVVIVPEMKGALSYASIPIPYSRESAGVVRELRRRLLEEGLIFDDDEQPLVLGNTKTSWMVWDPVLVKGKYYVQPTITVHVQAV